MGDGRDLGRIVGRIQSDESSQAAVDEVFSQWQSIQDNPDQIDAFTQELAPYLPQLSVAFLNTTVEIDNVATTYFDVIDESGDGVLQDSELQTFSENTTAGAARMFADYLLEHYNAFDASDGVAEDGIKREGLMTSEEGFFNPADGSYTRLREDGVFETTYQDGVVLLVRENGTAVVGDNFAASVYVIPGEPETIVENYGGLYGEVNVNGVTIPFYGLAEHTTEGVVITSDGGATTTYSADGSVVARDAEGRILSYSEDGQVLRRYEYDGAGVLVNYWDGNQHWWMDRRGVLTSTNGTWYVENGENGISQAASVYMTGDDVNILHVDGTIETAHRDGDITWTAAVPAIDAANPDSLSPVGMSATRNADGEIVETVIPPSSEPWRRMQLGNSEPPEYRWVQGVGPADAFDPTIEFTDNGTIVPDMTITFAMEGGRTRQFERNGNGTLVSVTNPDGSSFQRQADGTYLYFPPSVDGVIPQPVPATLTESTGEPVFTMLEQPAMTNVAFHRDGTMTSTRLIGDNVYISEDGVQTESLVHMDGQTVLRRDGFIEIVEDSGATTRYRDNFDGTWTMVSGHTDETGNFHETPNSSAFVRGGWAADGTFILFNDGDQNPNTFDPGNTYFRIEANGAVTEQSVSNGAISFTDESGFVNTMEFSGGQISRLTQTTPDGDHHITAHFANGNISSIQLPDGTSLVPHVENGVTTWLHTGAPPYVLAEAPIIGANGQIMLGTSSIWQMQDSTDPLYPGQTILQIRTENGFAYHAMDNSYAVGDSNQMATYTPNDVLIEQVFGDYRHRDDAVTVTYENGALVSLDLPGNDSCQLIGGVWFYSDGSQPMQADGTGGIRLSVPPQVDSISGTVTLNFLDPGDGEPIGMRVGASPFSETLMADGVVRSTSADGTVTTDRYPSGAVIQSTHGQTTSVALPNGSRYELVPNSGDPPGWNYIHNGVTETIHGLITYSPERQAVIVDNAGEQTIFQMDGGELISIQHTQNNLITITNLDGDRIVSVTMVDTNNTADTNQLVAHEVNGETVWHWMHNGEDITLSRSTVVTLDAEGGIIFENAEIAESNIPLIGETGWQVPERTGFNAAYSDSPANTQLSSLTLPDGQGSWTQTPEGLWQFTGPGGAAEPRPGTLTYENGVVTFVGVETAEVYTFAATGGLLESVSITAASGGVTTALYANGEIVSISLPADGSMSFEGDFWTVTVAGQTINLLGEPAFVNGELVMVNHNTSVAVYDSAGEMQFRTVEGVVSIDAAGQIVRTDEASVLAALATDSTWISTVAGSDGVLTLADMQAVLDSPNLTEQQQEILLYLVENFNELRPIYQGNGESGTLTLLSDNGVEIYGPNPGEVRRLASEELILSVNPYQPSPSLWTTIAPNGVLTRESLDDIVATGSINGYTLSPLERASAIYLQAHWNEIAGQQGEELLVAQEIQVASLLAYALARGINFPEPVEPVQTVEPTADPAAEVPPVVGQPVEVTTLDTTISDNSGGGAVSEVPTETYAAVDWLNRHQLVMRQYMIVGENGQRTGEIDESRVNTQVATLLDKRNNGGLTPEEEVLLNSLLAVQNYIATSTTIPHTAEGFFSSVLLNAEAGGDNIGARLLGPTDTIYSMARRFLVEDYCRDHNYTAEQTAALLGEIEQGMCRDRELVGYVSANLQTEIDFIFEANHIEGNNVAVGQLLILDPDLAAQSNDAIYLAPETMNSEAYTEIPPADRQSENVTHVQNRSTGEEAFIFETGITLTRSASGIWGAYDENGNFLGNVENNDVDLAAVASGNFILQLESNGDVPIRTIGVTDQMTTILFENNSSEYIYSNGLQISYSQSMEVDQVLVPTPTGSVIYTRLVANGVTTGYQVTYPDGTIENVAQPARPATDGSITILQAAGGQPYTLYADGTTSLDVQPVSEVEEETEAAA